MVDCEIPEKAIPQGRPFNPGWLHVLVIFALHVGCFAGELEMIFGRKH